MMVVESRKNFISAFGLRAEAGKAAGCRCLGLTTSFGEEVLRSAGADWIAPDLAAVPEEVFGGW